MKLVFRQPTLEFPYSYTFPGQASDEVILYATRANKVVLWAQRAGLVTTSIVIVMVGWWLASLLTSFSGGLVNATVGSFIQFGALVFALGFLAFGWWWATTLWRKSVCFVTTKRLTKFIATTPFNRHNLSLPLDMIVDTGSYTKGLLQALFQLGTFTARSAAASSGIATDEDVSGGGQRLNRKYFYIENVRVAEDLQHYIAKLLDAKKNHPDHLNTFRPFIPHLKGDARKQFMQQYPEYWS